MICSHEVQQLLHTFFLFPSSPIYHLSAFPLSRAPGLRDCVNVLTFNGPNCFALILTVELIALASCDIASTDYFWSGLAD